MPGTFTPTTWLNHQPEETLTASQNRRVSPDFWLHLMNLYIYSMHECVCLESGVCVIRVYLNTHQSHGEPGKVKKLGNVFLII